MVIGKRRTPRQFYNPNLVFVVRLNQGTMTRLGRFENVGFEVSDHSTVVVEHEI